MADTSSSHSSGYHPKMVQFGSSKWRLHGEDIIDAGGENVISSSLIWDDDDDISLVNWNCSDSSEDSHNTDMCSPL